MDTHKNSEDATMLSMSPRTWTTLRTIGVVIDSANSLYSSQTILNNWSSPLTQEEDNTINDVLWRWDLNDKSFVKNILSRIECHEITHKVLYVRVLF